MAEFFCVCKWLAHLRCAMGRHRVAIAAARQFGCNRRKNGLASVGLGGATIGADLSDNRAALPLRARGVLRQRLRGSEFARAWRKFRVRGLSTRADSLRVKVPVHEAQTRGKAPSPRPSPGKREREQSRPSDISER